MFVKKRIKRRNLNEMKRNSNMRATRRIHISVQLRSFLSLWTHLNDWWPCSSEWCIAFWQLLYWLATRQLSQALVSDSVTLCHGRRGASRVRHLQMVIYQKESIDHFRFCSSVGYLGVGGSNGHVTDGITRPQKVKLVTPIGPISSRPHISKTGR